MLKNSTEETAGRLLREIVSYCNMMLRNTVKGYDKKSYEPLSTINQIEALITSKENQNKELKSIIDSYTKKNYKNQERINELELEIVRIEKMHEILHNKMRDFYKKNKKDLKESPIKSTIRDSKQELPLDLDNIDKVKKSNISKLTNLISQESKDKKKENNLFRTKTEADTDKSRYLTHSVNLDFTPGVQQFVDHANRLFFYQAQLNTRPREEGVFIQAHKRMKQKLNRLQKIEQNSDRFNSLGNLAFNTVNDHIDNLIAGLEALNH